MTPFTFSLVETVSNSFQASIEYVRYLEDCVAKLKAQHDEDALSPHHRPSHSPAHTPTAFEAFVPSHSPDTHTPDVEMAESTAPSPTYTAAPSHRSSVSVSPALQPEDRRGSCSSVSTDPRRYSYSTSAATSPACGPLYGFGGVSLPPIGSALASPALGPMGRDADQEATAALLMLNTDRRGYGPRRDETGGGEARRGSGRGMSVRDLLST